MPRLFIDDYSASNIVSKLPTLDNYYTETNVRKMLFSQDGIYQINNNHISRLMPVDIPTIKLDGFTVDNSYFKEQDVISQVPFNASYAEIVEMHFCVDKKSCVHLVVEGKYENDDIVLTKKSTTCTNENSHNRYNRFTPCSVYFTSLENLDNELISKEVNLLLTII
jgi:hypothetical protein|uniref:Uncharacterized protein n=1 Tax=viral metagenome TaxID=1070528 RepID=A0A6C0IJL5_9ZZZZ